MNDDKQRKKCRHKSNGMKTIINKRKMLLTKLQQILHGWIKKKVEYYDEKFAFCRKNGKLAAKQKWNNEEDDGPGQC